MLTKRIVSVLILCCLLITGCSFQKTDTSELRASGVSSATSEFQSADKVLGGNGYDVLLAVAHEAGATDEKDQGVEETIVSDGVTEKVEKTSVTDIQAEKEEPPVIEPEDAGEVAESDTVEEEATITTVEYVEGDVKAYNSKLDDYLASLGTTLEEAQKQAEDNRKAEKPSLTRLRTRRSSGTTSRPPRTCPLRS